jgi:hypothetical protein
MMEIKGQVIIYKVPISGNLCAVSPYLFIDRLADKIMETFHQVQVDKLFASRKETFHQVSFKLPKSYSKEQILLLSKQIEIIASNLLKDLEGKIYLARLAG